MILHKLASFAIRITAVILILFLAPGLSTVSAAVDRTPPTTPANLRVTSFTSHSVSLAWDPSRDASGSITYIVCCAQTTSASISHPTTSFTFSGIEAGTTYSFRVFAVDAAGNKSGYSNSVTVTTPPDNTPPTAPVLSSAGTGPTYTTLTWTPAVDDGSLVWYSIFLNDSLYRHVNGANTTSISLAGLTPQTTYAFSLVARDARGNLSPPSNTVAVTTTAPDPNDTQPPTQPGNLVGSDRGCGETYLAWTQSTDNVDPQFAIRYDIYINGVLHPESSVTGAGQTFAFASVAGQSTIEVVAVDSAGNRSIAASITLVLSALCY